MVRKENPLVVGGVGEEQGFLSRINEFQRERGSQYIAFRKERARLSGSSCDLSSVGITYKP